MKLFARLRGWRKKNLEELHTIFDATMFGVGLVFVGLGATFMVLWVVGDLDLGVLGTGGLAMFVGGMDIRLSFVPWKKGGKKK